MHIILGALGLIVTILVLINRLNDAGIDIGWLNPFTWHRRRKFRLHHDLNPVFKLTSPLEVAAVYIVGTVKIDGDMTVGEKQCILDIFQQEFHLDIQQAKGLLASSTHLIGNGQEFYDLPHRVIERSKEQFSPEQLESMLKLLNQAASKEGSPSDQQLKYIEKIKKALPKQPLENKWH